MTTERFADNAVSFLAAPIAAGDLSLTLTTIQNFPTSPEFRLRIGQELLLVTNVSGAVYTVTRGIEGTTPASHPQNARVVCVLTAGGLDELRSEIEAEINTAVSTSLPILGQSQVIVGDTSGTNQFRQLTMDDILQGFQITSLGLNVSTVVEVGTTLSSIAASATYQSGPATSGTLSDDLGGSWTFLTPFSSGTRSGSVQKLTVNASWVVSLSATESAVTKTGTVTVNWEAKVYHGPSVVGTYNAAFITGLASANLQASRACSFTDNMGSGQYDYFAIPSSYGTPTFVFGVLAGGWALVASGVAVTSNGVTLNYDLYKTNQPNLGSTAWTVS